MDNHKVSSKENFQFLRQICLKFWLEMALSILNMLSLFSLSNIIQKYLKLFHWLPEQDIKIVG